MEHNIEKIARKRAAAKMSWFAHAAIYVLVNLLLASIAFGQGRNWAMFPALGWGLGLAIHGIAVFMVTGAGGMFERLVDRERAALARDPW